MLHVFTGPSGWTNLGQCMCETGHNVGQLAGPKRSVVLSLRAGEVAGRIKLLSERWRS